MLIKTLTKIIHWTLFTHYCLNLGILWILPNRKEDRTENEWNSDCKIDCVCECGKGVDNNHDSRALSLFQDENTVICFHCNRIKCLNHCLFLVCILRVYFFLFNLEERVYAIHGFGFSFIFIFQPQNVCLCWQHCTQNTTNKPIMKDMKA